MRLDRVRQRDDTRVIDVKFTELVHFLVERGVMEKSARRLLFGVPEDVDVLEQIEWIDSIIGKDPQKFENPAAMYFSFIRDGIAPPSSFVSSHRRKALEDKEQDRRTAEAILTGRRLDLDQRYSEYCAQQADAYIVGLNPDARAKLIKEARKAAVKHVSHFDALTAHQQQDLTSRFEFNIVFSEIPVLTRDEFQSREQFRQLTFDSSPGR
ncbi:MAG: hypothetical protein WKF37_05505 [Bryobacteraceae bacterium]